MEVSMSVGDSVCCSFCRVHTGGSGVFDGGGKTFVGFILAVFFACVVHFRLPSIVVFAEKRCATCVGI